MRGALWCLVVATSLAARLATAAGDAATPAVPAMSTPVEIDRACNAAEKHADTHRREARIFGDVAPERDATPMWRSFPSAGALKDATPDGPPDTQASVWPAVNGVVFAEMFFQSGAGDWAQFADLCYRPDGTLARAVDTYNTFSAGVDDSEGISRVHTLHFDPEGNVIRKRSKLLNLETRKPVKGPFSGGEDRIFKRLTDLPFSDLLSSPPK